MKEIIMFDIPERLFEIDIRSVALVTKSQVPVQENEIIIMKSKDKDAKDNETTLQLYSPNLISLEKAITKRKMFIHLIKPYTEETPYIDKQNHIILKEDVAKANDKIHYNLAHKLMDDTGVNIGHTEKKGWGWLYDTFYDDSESGIEIQKAFGIPEENAYPHALTGIIYLTDDGIEALKSGEFEGGASIQGKSLAKTVNPITHYTDGIFNHIAKALTSGITEKSNELVSDIVLKRVEDKLLGIDNGAYKKEVSKSLNGFKKFVKDTFSDFYKVYNKRGESMSVYDKKYNAEDGAYNVISSEVRSAISEILPELVTQSVNKAVETVSSGLITEEMVEKAIEKKLGSLEKSVESKKDGEAEKKTQEAETEIKKAQNKQVELNELAQILKDNTEATNNVMTYLNKALGVPNTEELKKAQDNNDGNGKSFYQKRKERLKSNLDLGLK